MIERFWEKVQMGSGCWEWQGATLKGYGQFHLDGETRYSHHVAYQEFTGVRPVYLLHKCDNPPCVRPSHLQQGDQQANVRDMIQKGRGYAPPSRKGSDHWGAKVSEADVLEIRRKALTLPRIGRLKILGEEYGLSASAICSIIKRKSWRHI